MYQPSACCHHSRRPLCGTSKRVCVPGTCTCDLCFLSSASGMFTVTLYCTHAVVTCKYLSLASVKRIILQKIPPLFLKKAVNPFLALFSINPSHCERYLGTVRLRPVSTAVWCYLEQTAFHPFLFALCHQTTSAFAFCFPQSRESKPGPWWVIVGQITCI